MFPGTLIRLLLHICYACLLAVLLQTATARADALSILAQGQVISTREYMASQHFFDRIPKNLAISSLDIHKQIEYYRQETSHQLSTIYREYPFSTTLKYAIPMGLIIIPAIIKRHTLANMFSQLPEMVRVTLGTSAPLFGLLALSPITTLNTQAYFAVLPPTPPEADLIIQYGGKKNLLASSTQSYIENELFYAIWQNPNPESYEKLHKILDKALRLPLYGKKLEYSKDRIRAALRYYPDHVIERLKRFALTEIMLQRMRPRPDNHYPIYFQGPPGTGKTHAAKKLAQAMGTTLASVTLDGASIDDIVGTPFESYDAKAGRMLDAIIANTDSSNDINHTNQILIIDEFDRLLTSDDKRSEEVLSFMLKLLDPSKRYFYSPYLKTTIHLPDTIILAGNEDLSELAKKNPRLAALVSRLEILHFQGFNNEAKHNIALEAIIPKMEKSYQSLGGTMAEFKLPPDDLAQIDNFIDQDTDPGLRSMEKFIAFIFQKHLTSTLPTQHKLN